MKYARDGFAFYSVSTPSVFLEAELPLNANDWTSKDYRQWDELETATERHGCAIQKNSYQLG